MSPQEFEKSRQDLTRRIREKKERIAWTGDQCLTRQLKEELFALKNRRDTELTTQLTGLTRVVENVTKGDEKSAMYFSLESSPCMDTTAKEPTQPVSNNEKLFSLFFDEVFINSGDGLILTETLMREFGIWAFVQHSFKNVRCEIQEFETMLKNYGLKIEQRVYVDHENAKKGNFVVGIKRINGQ